MSTSSTMENLRQRVIDESEPLAGLLRTCLLLGAETGSDALRAWASAELHGYDTGDEVPKYRQFQLSLTVDGWIGAMPKYEYTVAVWHLHQEDRDRLQAIKILQSVEELASLAASTKRLQHRHDGLLVAARRAEGLPFTRIEQAYCLISPAAMAGIVGKIRTALVEMVADMTSGVPFDGLPPRNQVDSAVQVNLHGSRDQYHIKVGNNSGVIGQGPGSSQTQNLTNTGQDLADLLAQLRTAAAEIDDDDDRADAARAVDDFEQAVRQENPEPEVVRSRWRAVQRVGAVVGGAFGGALLSESATAVVGAITSAM